MYRTALAGAAAGCLVLVAAPAAAQTAPAPTNPAPPSPATTDADPTTVDSKEVVVVGQRGSVQTSFAPIATLDAATIAATGATSIGELLQTIRGVTQSADGSDPIFLLNAQRVSGYQDIGSLPPEAIEKVDVLPEPVALKYGYPPTRRVLNFVTKRRFRQLELIAGGGLSTRGANAIATGHTGLTRLHDDRRLTTNLDYSHRGAVFDADRNVLPDPDIPFDAIGNITGVGGGEIDPALSALAGRPVTIAPVPETRPTRADVAAGANQPRLFRPGDLRSLSSRNDTLKGEVVVADRLGAGIAGSLSLSAERAVDHNLAGPASATLTVPVGNPASPFTRDVLVQRYLTEATPLRLDQTTDTLHAGGTLRGAIAGWQWDVTGALDQKNVHGMADRAIDLSAAQAAIDAGANPFEPLAPALVSTRLTDRAAQRTRTMNTKAVVVGSPLTLPAGQVNLTATLEAERLTTRSRTRGADPFDLSLGRTRIEGGGAIDVPLASARQGFVGGAGELSANAAVTVRSVEGYGTLTDTTFGLNWAPIPALQFTGLVKQSEAAPSLEQQGSPVVRVPNVSVFDYGTGRTTLTTLVQGGNPDLLAERRRVTSAAANVRLLSGPRRELRISGTYSDTVIRNQTGTVYALSPLTEALLPQLFTRDPTGQLTSLTFQPINLAYERQRSLALVLNTNGIIGKPPAPPPPPKPGDPPAGPPNQPAYFYGGLGPTIRFADRLRLSPGTPSLDLLAGDTITGGGAPRFAGYGYGGVSLLGNGMSFNFYYQQASRVRSATPAADLTFGSLFKLNVSGFISLHHFTPHQAWTRKLQVKLDINNITDARQNVRDATGRIPNRFQPDLLDPIGRTATLTLRKLF